MYIIHIYIYTSRKLASANWSPSCFSKVLGGSNLQLCELSQSTTAHKQFDRGSITPMDTVGLSPPYLSSSTLVLHWVTFSRASKGPLRCRKWTFESSPSTGHHVGYAEFPHPGHAPVHNHIMFSSSSPPTYIASIRNVGLDVRLTNTPQLQTRSSTLTKKLRSCAVHFVFSCQTLPS